MTIHIRCPHCAKPFAVPDQLAGRRGKCDRCINFFQIPQPALAVTAAVPPRRQPDPAAMSGSSPARSPTLPVRARQHPRGALLVTGGVAAAVSILVAGFLTLRPANRPEPQALGFTTSDRSCSVAGHDSFQFGPASP